MGERNNAASAGIAALEARLAKAEEQIAALMEFHEVTFRKATERRLGRPLTENDRDQLARGARLSDLVRAA